MTAVEHVSIINESPLLVKPCFTHQLVGVPVQRSLLQHKPVLLPFDTQEAFALFLPVQPALVVWVTQLFDRDPSSAHCTIACVDRKHMKATSESCCSSLSTEKQRHSDESLEEASCSLKISQSVSIQVEIGHCVWSNNQINSKNNTEETHTASRLQIPHPAYLFHL